jgi:hypothetical protein
VEDNVLEPDAALRPVLDRHTLASAPVCPKAVR